MLVCTKCNNQQEDGKFCGECGGPVELMAAGSQENTTEQESVVQGSATQAATVETSQAQPTADAVKSGLQNYWSYFITKLKNPSRAFQTDEGQFVNGLVTIGLYAIIYALSLYFLANSLLSAFGSYYTESIPFFSILSRLVFLIVIIFAITFGSAFIILKIGKVQASFKTLITQYGSVIVPFTALNVVAMIGGLIGSVQLTSISIMLSMLFAFIFIPVLFVYEKLTAANHAQRLYLSLATLILIAIISFVLGDAVLVNLMDSLDGVFNNIF